MWWRCPLSFLSGPVYTQASTEQPRSFEHHSNSNKQESGNSGLANASCLPVSLSHSILALLLTDQLLRLHFLDHPPSHKTSFCSQTFRRVNYSQYRKFDTNVLKAFQRLFLFIFVCGIYVCTCLWVVHMCLCVCVLSRVEATGQCLVSSSLLSTSSFETGSLTNLKFNDLPGLAVL